MIIINNNKHNSGRGGVTTRNIRGRQLQRTKTGINWRTDSSNSKEAERTISNTLGVVLLSYTVGPFGASFFGTCSS